MTTITKQFGAYAFAHRQSRHTGHCQLIHGHSWVFEVTYTAKEIDANGFVLDFGGESIRDFRKDLENVFDHTLVLSEDDACLEILDVLSRTKLANIITVPDCSAEGLAKYLLRVANLHIAHDDFMRGVEAIRVTVWEGEKNSATYEADKG
jgi:6-pyruvoyltetrahydropterin/6-carboxytetrahydropterin synthase